MSLGPKNAQLFSTSINASEFQSLEPASDRYFFVPRNSTGADVYSAYFSLKDLFPIGGIGVKFRKDNLLVREHFSPKSVREMVQDVLSLDAADLTRKYNFTETTDWSLSSQRENFLNGADRDIIPVEYRPFDRRYAYYPLDRISRIIPRGDSRKSVMAHFIHRPNLGLSINRQIEGPRPFTDALVCASIFDLHGLSVKEANHVTPLYFYVDDSEEAGQGGMESGMGVHRRLNFDPKIYAAICKAANFTPSPDAGEGDSFRTAVGDDRRPKFKSLITSTACSTRQLIARPSSSS